MESVIHSAIAESDHTGRGEWWDVSRRAISPLFRIAAEVCEAELIKVVGHTDADDIEEARKRWFGVDAATRPWLSRKVRRSQ